MRIVLIAALAILLAGCGAFGVTCTLELRAGLNVAVFDASGDRVCTAQVVARSADHEETLEVFPGPDAGDCVYTGLWERAGTFTVTATSAQFDGQLEQTVTIEEDECHVIAETLELRAK